MEVDEYGGPGGLEAGFAFASVAALAGVVAVDEQAEQPFNPWAGPAEVLAGRWVFERFAAGLQEVFAAADLELPAASALYTGQRARLVVNREIAVATDSTGGAVRVLITERASLFSAGSLGPQLARMAKANSVSPAPTTTYCIPSSS